MLENGNDDWVLCSDIVFAKEEGEEGEALALGHRCDCVQVRTGEENGPTGIGFVAMWAIFWKGEMPTFIIGIEVEGEGKTAVRCCGAQVVAVGVKEAVFF